MRQFENLEIWKDSKDLVLQMYSNLKDNKDFGFRDQIQRAAVSIMNNKPRVLNTVQMPSLSDI